MGFNLESFFEELRYALENGATKEDLIALLDREETYAAECGAI